MAITQTITCDVCGAVKRETNHWWQAMVNVGLRAMLVQPIFGEIGWGGPGMGDANSEVVHLCGQDCVNRKVAEIMKQSSGPNFTGQSGDPSRPCPVALQTSEEEA